MITANLAIENCLDGDEATKAVTKFFKGNKRTAAGYVAIVKTKHKYYANQDKSDQSIKEKVVYQVTYDTNKYPALNSKHCDTLEGARSVATNVTRQMMFELGIKKILFIDVPAWVDYQEKND